MSLGSSTESYPAFARIGLRENPGNTSTSVRNNRDSGAVLAVECTSKQYVSSSSRVKVVSLFLSQPHAVKMCAAIASLARCESKLELSEDFPQISRTLLYEVITEDLDYRKLSARWVPKLLSEELKAQQIGAALSFLENYERKGDAFLDQIVTGDETWVRYVNAETELQSMQWGHTHSPKKPTKSCRTATKVQEFNWEVLDHPTFSPDLVSSDYHLFMHMKTWLGSKHFDDDEELKTSVVGWLQSQAAEFYNCGISKFVKRYDKCLNVTRNYVEK
ncbi:hypothetical protein ANN_13065 [Periplaneta americana]|uniref:Histone-lysine N-methyltransferase SETMAR n=1 Tax=Periplaneta americana TaxID=6978 RepID=A0ABQ8TIW4_PERAM|nr:hypothetical protein ANN_13065 [Periplaneta americana]